MNTAWSPRSQGLSPKASLGGVAQQGAHGFGALPDAGTPGERAPREGSRDPEVSQRGADELLELGAGRLGDVAEVEMGGDDAPDDGVELVGDGAAHRGFELPGDARGPGRLMHVRSPPRMVADRTGRTASVQALAERLPFGDDEHRPGSRRCRHPSGGSPPRSVTPWMSRPVVGCAYSAPVEAVAGSREPSRTTLATFAGSSHVGTCPQPFRRTWRARGIRVRARLA